MEGKLAVVVALLGAAASSSADAQEDLGRRWLVPDGSRQRVALSTGFGVHPAPVRWWLSDLELDGESGFMIRGEFGMNLFDRVRPLKTLTQLAVGWRWWRKLELGAAFLMVAGRDIATSGSDRFRGAGSGFYIGAGVPEGLRVSATIGNAYGREIGNAVVLVYRVQVPIVVVDRLRLLFVSRGYFSWPGPFASLHRLQIEALIDGQWRVFVGAVFDGGEESSMGGPSVGGSVGALLGVGVRTR